MKILRLIIENFDEILPILIFIVVAISSAFANLKKKRGEGGQEPQPAQAEPAPAPPRARERRAVERPESISDEMRRTLEGIFQAKEPRPAAAKQAARPSPRAADDSEWARSVAEREAKSALKDARKAAEKAARTASAAQDAARGASVKPAAGYALAARARSGVVWSEILQPPVSMR